MWQCCDCGSKFKKFKVLHDVRQVREDEYDDEYVCPVCGSDEFMAIEEDKDAD